MLFHLSLTHLFLFNIYLSCHTKFLLPANFSVHFNSHVFLPISVYHFPSMLFHLSPTHLFLFVHFQRSRPFSFLPVSLYFNYHVFLPIYKSPLCLYFTYLLFLPPFFSTCVSVNHLPVTPSHLSLSYLYLCIFQLPCLSTYFSIYHLPIMPPYLSPTLPTFLLPTCFCLKFTCHASLPISV